MGTRQEMKEWCCMLCRPYKFFDYKADLIRHENAKHPQIILDGKLLTIQEVRQLESARS